MLKLKVPNSDGDSPVEVKLTPRKLTEGSEDKFVNKKKASIMIDDDQEEN